MDPSVRAVLSTSEQDNPKKGVKLMRLEDLKMIISEKTDIPVEILTGNNEDQVLDCARWILTERARNHSTSGRSVRDQFADWFNARTGEESHHTPLDELSRIEETLKAETRSYPVIKDNGDPYSDPVHMSDPRSPREQFESWFRELTAYDPRKE